MSSPVPSTPDEHRALIAEAFAQAVGLQQAGAWEVAETLYREILRIDPQHVQTMANLSSLYLRLQRLEDALHLLTHALTLHPDEPVLHYNLGRVLVQLKRPGEALAAYDRAIALAPERAVFHSNRGIALVELGRYAEAIESYDAAIARDNTHADYYSNRGNAYAYQRHLAQAEADFHQAIALNPDAAEAPFGLALLELMQGDFTAGWQRHETRWLKPTFAVDRRTLATQLWLGDAPIAGKTLLVYSEQGLGDIIQCCRYIPLLEAQGATVILEVHAPLVGLMRSLSPTVTIIARHSVLPPHDLHCPIMSLPLAFETVIETIPAEVPYLSASREKRTEWAARLGPKTKPRIGLVWSGSAKHENDRNRSIALEAFAPLFALPFEFHALQLEIRDSDRPFLPSLVTHETALRDFTDTAALVEEMDVVISVDTSVAHLVGALAKPLWLLVPYLPDYRWLLDREDSPWYPTARLFRQTTNGRWAEPLAAVKEALAGFSANTP